MGHVNVAVFVIFSLMTTHQIVNGESILDWLWQKKPAESTVVVADGVPLVSIPYESMTDDEKFLQQAAKFTEIQASSPLEICQHKVIMKIKTSCNAMSEEELAKLSVNLLNCQSAVEGRKTYPCTEEMSIKECTTDMDADTWNTYHLMSNRARAVCYSARSLQFRALAELTVNKLIQTSHAQIHTLNSLKEGQDQLKEKTAEALDSLHKGNSQLIEQQQNLFDAQITAHNLVSENLRELNNEKAMIRTGHAELATMTNDIKTRLDIVSEKFQDYAEVHEKRHEEIMQNLTHVQNQAFELLRKIEESAGQYEITLKKLEQINASINYVWNLTNKTWVNFEEKIGWITHYIGNTEEQLHKIYQTFAHAVYLLMSMILAAFLQAPLLTRIGVITLTPLNLITFWKYDSDACMDFISITALISLITALHYLIDLLSYVFSSRPKFNVIESRKAKLSENDVKNDFRASKRTSLLRRLKNEIYYSRKSISQFLYYWIGKLGIFFQSSFHTVRNMSPREVLFRSCSYEPRKVRDNIVEDTLNHNINLSDDISYSSYSDYAFNDENIDEKHVQHRSRHHEYISTDNYHLSKSVSGMSKKSCVGYTKSGSVCKSNAAKGYNYCSRHLSTMFIGKE